MGFVGLCSWQNFDSIGVSESNPLSNSQSTSHRRFAQCSYTNPRCIRHSAPLHARICRPRPGRRVLNRCFPPLGRSCTPIRLPAWSGFSGLLRNSHRGPLLALVQWRRLRRRYAPRSSTACIHAACDLAAPGMDLSWIQHGYQVLSQTRTRTQVD